MKNDGVIMTRREYNAIRRAAFDAFMKQNPDFGAHDTITAVQIMEGQKSEIWLVHYPTQVNKSTLAEKGFSPDATIKTLFKADKQMKTLSFYGMVWNTEEE